MINTEPTAAELKAAKEQEKIAEEDELVSKEIEIILKRSKRALQTYLVYSEFGVIPKVRMVLVDQEVSKDEAKAEEVEKKDKKKK